MNKVIENVRAALSVMGDKVPYPDWADESIVAPGKLTQGSLVDSFEENLRSVKGIPMRDAQAVASYLKEHQNLHGYCAPELDPMFAEAFESTITCDLQFDRDRYDSYSFGITRASAAIAESGSLVLNDAETSCRLGALTPWVHIAVVQRSSIVRTIGEAISSLDRDPNIIWVTGPSKTADVEGILIQGVHGPGVQIALII